MPVFQGVAPCQTSFTLSRVISLLHLANSLSIKEFNPSSQEITIFQNAERGHANFSLSCFILLWDSAHSPSIEYVILFPREDEHFSACST